MLTAGQIVDRYEVDAIIGQGGMAVVYRVRHRQLGSEHALKVLTVTRADIRERLLQEGRIQATLHHPNIVRVHDVLHIDGAPGLVMEYVAGRSLDRWLGGRPLPLEEAETLFRGITSGVRFAHDRGLVHRDLKPANVLLLDVGDALVPKVTDFGVAKVLQESTEEGGTRAGVALGTPRYMAPEQIRDARSVDARADVYALGCILYEMLAGRPPVDGDDVIAIHLAASAGRREPLQGMPDRVTRAIDGALAPRREDRIPDCATLIEVLGGGSWVPGTPSAPAPRAQRPGIPDAPPGPVTDQTWTGEEAGVVEDTTGGAGRRPEEAEVVTLQPTQVAEPPPRPDAVDPLHRPPMVVPSPGLGPPPILVGLPPVGVLATMGVAVLVVAAIAVMTLPSIIPDPVPPPPISAPADEVARASLQAFGKALADDAGVKRCLAAHRAANPTALLPTADIDLTAAPNLPIAVAFVPGTYVGTALPGCLAAADAAMPHPVVDTSRVLTERVNLRMPY